MDKTKIIQNLNELFKQRAKFYEFFDENIEKMPKSDVFDFQKAKDLNAKEVYEHFYHFDYAMRKLLPSIFKAYEIKEKDLDKDF
ncbi:CmeU family protein [Campylobacter cuniculorum]|uniref:Uncharacterized protein n=2 Tax=Campylobacter cuniculorum TaxID=374106 RepID=A0A1W6BYN1_9BACT|nr:CmeU family protein [Campylobacter cuniculorum]ARJ57197.1 hypothetical protein CCUN_1618 [Campylobacter cuniculorum DSM 23162 = LMG 24588]QOR04638.1 hypothetical protein A0071_01420 [Campylobacter cuniculorum]